MSGVRCIDGRLFRHHPFPDDPDYEYDIGACQDCGGKGCVNPIEDEKLIEELTVALNSLLVASAKLREATADGCSVTSEIFDAQYQAEAKARAAIAKAHRRD